MAFMNKETFEILQNFAIAVPQTDTTGAPDKLPDYANGYFEVDELIALPIQALNRKGYATESCCSAHPFHLLTLMLIDGKLVSPEEHFSPYKVEQIGGRSSFIRFQKGVTLPSLPPGFAVDEVRKIAAPSDDSLVIKKHYYYDDNNVYAFMRDVLDTMQQLYQWALGLPEAQT